MCERACQSACVFNMLYITLYILADSVIWGDGCSTVTTAYICVLLKQVTMTKQCIGQGHHTQAVDLTNITSIRACTRMHVGVCMCVYGPDLSKNLLLYECTGRACGEVKTLRPSCLGQSVSCGLCLNS